MVFPYVYPGFPVRCMCTKTLKVSVKTYVRKSISILMSMHLVRVHVNVMDIIE